MRATESKKRNFINWLDWMHGLWLLLGFNALLTLEPTQMTSIWSSIQNGDAEGVRQYLLENPSLASTNSRFPHLTWEKSVENDAYKLLGAYLGDK